MTDFGSISFVLIVANQYRVVSIQESNAHLVVPFPGHMHIVFMICRPDGIRPGYRQC